VVFEFQSRLKRADTTLKLQFHELDARYLCEQFVQVRLCGL
jgi:hypothetical protein